MNAAFSLCCYESIAIESALLDSSSITCSACMLLLQVVGELELAQTMLGDAAHVNELLRARAAQLESYLKRVIETAPGALAIRFPSYMSTTCISKLHRVQFVVFGFEFNEPIIISLFNVPEIISSNLNSVQFTHICWV